jgi:hypothetical protein
VLAVAKGMKRRSYCLAFALTLLVPSIVVAESPPQPFGFATVIGGSNREDAANAVSFTATGDTCVVGKSAGGITCPNRRWHRLSLQHRWSRYTTLLNIEILLRGKQPLTMNEDYCAR